MSKATNGRMLEARVHRVVIAQGVFAERGLIPSASSDHRLLATDIDVLATEYQFNFHSSRHHYECKSGKVSLLDRILWMNGVRGLLNADGSALVLRTFDAEAIVFAKRLGIDLMNIADIQRLETEMKIPASWWPGRSGPTTLDELRKQWQSSWSTKTASDKWLLAKSSNAFLEVDGWERADYRTLNRLFRLVGELGTALRSEKDELLRSCYGYVIGGLCVRLSQIILFVCSDLVSREPSARKEYLRQRLTFGDNNPQYSLNLIKGTAGLIESTSQKPDGRARLTVDTSRLTTVPPYGEDFIRLVEEFLANPLEARYAPLACELKVFGTRELPAGLSQLRFAFESGRRLVDYCIGFLIRNFEVSSEVLSELAGRVHDQTSADCDDRGQHDGS